MKLRLEARVRSNGWEDYHNHNIDVDVTATQAGHIARQISTMPNVNQVRILHEGRGQGLARDGQTVWFEDFAIAHGIKGAQGGI